MFHELLFQVAGAADWLPGFYYLWGGMNDSLSTVDHETLSDARYLSRLDLTLSSDKFIPRLYDIRRNDRWDNVVMLCNPTLLLHLK